MAKTLGFHLVKSAYGQWLPGDEHGSWSEAWDEQISFFEPHQLHPGDPVRHRMAMERMKHDPVQLTEAMMDAVVDSIAHCIAVSAGGLAVAAAAIGTTHFHLLIPYSTRNIENTAKWLADCATKAVHRNTEHVGPVWAKGKWRTYISEPSHWQNAMAYIERHNIQHGRTVRPYSFLT